MFIGRSRGRRAGIVTIASLVLWSAFGFVATSTVQAQGSVDSSKLPPVQVVVLADESGSLKPVAVAAEQEAANAIAENVLAAGSTVSIVGFGSDNGQVGQVAVQTYCDKTVFTGQQQRDQVATCIDHIHGRTPAEGYDTDQAKALRQAYDLLNDASTEPKIVFLLTDGKLNVADSPSYGAGRTEDERDAAARDDIKLTKSKLAGIKAQVWPLGFGEADSAELQSYATGTSCSPQESAPAAEVIADSSALVSAVKRAFQSATCVKFGPDDVGSLQGGGTLALRVTIPPIASDASIIVFKRDPSFDVAFQGPGGSPITGPAGPDGAQFEIAGQTSATTTLHIIEPKAGPWTVVVTSKPGAAAQDVRATVAYQAAVNATLNINPPQPTAGQTVEVDMSVRARGATITNPDDLNPLTFVANVAGAGIPSSAPVTLTDPDGDGTYTGTIALPQVALGDLTFTGRVTGVGIGGDTRTYNTSVQTAAAQLQGQITLFPDPSGVTVGDTVPGELAITNAGSSTVQLQLRSDDATQGIAASSVAVTAAPGSSTTPFNVQVSPSTAPGGAQVTLRLVDSSGKVVAQRLFTTDIKPVPGLLQRFLILWIVLAALVALAVLAVIAMLRSRARKAAVGGLKAQLYRGDALQRELTPRNPRARAFRFVLNDDFQGASLQYAGTGDADAFVVARTKAGISMTRPGDDRNPIVAPGERRSVGPDLAVMIVDERGGTASQPPESGFGADQFGAGQFGSGPLTSTGGFGAVGGNGSSHHDGQFDDLGVRQQVPTQRPTDQFASSYEDPFDAKGRQTPNSTGPYPPADSYSDPNNPF